MKLPEEDKLEDHGEARGLGDVLSRTVVRVAHEMLAPLAASRNIVHWLRMRWRSVDPSKVDQRLADLEVQLEALVRVTDNLNFLRQGSQVGIEAKSPTSLSLVIKSVIQTIRFMLGTEAAVTPIKVSTSGVDSFPSLRIPPDQLNQVIFNLLHNAVKYRNIQEKQTRVSIDCAVERDRLVIRVSDWGIGVQNEWKEEIFEEGVRAPNAVRTAVTGSGIGLFVTRSLLRQYGGDLVLQNISKPTQFTLVLPKTAIWHESAAPNQGHAGDGYRRP